MHIPRTSVVSTPFLRIFFFFFFFKTIFINTSLDSKYHSEDNPKLFQTTKKKVLVLYTFFSLPRVVHVPTIFGLEIKVTRNESGWLQGHCKKDDVSSSSSSSSSSSLVVFVLFSSYFTCIVIWGENTWVEYQNVSSFGR